MLQYESITCEAEPLLHDCSQRELISPVEFNELSIFQKILLITDGTLTEILETYLNEPIHIDKLSERVISEAPNKQFPEIGKNESLLERKILLQGEKSRNNWLYAESFIIPDRLDIQFQNDLIKSRIPIGKLWKMYRMETFKEPVTFFQKKAGQLADYFEINSEDMLLCRTYRIFSDRQLFMTITEKFPLKYYV